MTKQNEQQAGSQFSRVYVDIATEKHHAAKLAAITSGKTLKAWLEGLIDAALAPQKGKGKK